MLFEVKIEEKTNKNSIWLIFQKQHFLFQEFQRAGYQIFDPYRGENKIIPRVIRKMHFSLHLPFRPLINDF